MLQGRSPGKATGSPGRATCPITVLPPGTVLLQAAHLGGLILRAQIQVQPVLAGLLLGDAGAIP